MEGGFETQGKWETQQTQRICQGTAMAVTQTHSTMRKHEVADPCCTPIVDVTKMLEYLL